MCQFRLLSAINRPADDVEEITPVVQNHQCAVQNAGETLHLRHVSVSVGDSVSVSQSLCR